MLIKLTIDFFDNYFPNNPKIFNMTEIEFNNHRVNSRKDLLHFIEENCDKDLYQKIGKNPEAWIDELSIINNMLNRNDMISMTGMFKPPINEPVTIKLSDRVLLYRGENKQLTGLWINKAGLEDEIDGPRSWTHYKLGSEAILKINENYQEIDYKEFLPENFEKKSAEVIKEKGFNKRPIFKFPLIHNGKEITVYAKGADINLSFYYDHSKPSYRLTNIAGISKTTSKKEMEITQELSNLGVAVPTIIGYYKTDIEEFLFLEKVEGENPKKYIETHKEELIKKDAQMLASLCLAGYRKMGFNDFDDKIFDGNKLYLIDVDECRDLYFILSPEYRKMLINPKDSKLLNEFRNNQENIFKIILKDTLYRYRDSLTPTNQEKELYIKNFAERIGWTDISKDTIKEMISFPENYMTLDSYMAMMCDTD